MLIYFKDSSYRLMKIAVIGSGNMGGALVRGLVASGAVAPQDIICTAATQKSLEKLQSRCPGIEVTTENIYAVAKAQCIVLAVKPWIVPQIAAEIAGFIKPESQFIVSMAASPSLEELQKLFGEKSAIIRAIPNTAIEICKGVTFLSSTQQMQKSSWGEEATRLFSALGGVWWVGEKELNAGMALASCGIAYALKYLKSATDGGVELGLKPALAREIVAQTMIGAASLVKENSSSPDAEIDRVTTPGGLTIRGLNAMEEKGFTASVLAGLRGGTIK